MIFILIKAVLAFILGWLIWRAIPITIDYFEFKRLRAQGVVFMGNNSYSLLRDVKLMIGIMKKYPTSFSYELMMKEEMKVETLPPLVGRIFMGKVYLMFTSMEHLQDLYVNKNQ